MSALHELSLMEQMEEAARKENREWDNADVGKVCHLYALLLLRLYAEFARGFIRARNYAPGMSEDEVPRGWQLNVSPRSPLFSSPFTAAPLFRGVTLFSLKSATQGGVPITYDAIVQAALQRTGDVPLALADDYAGVFANFSSVGQASFHCVVQAHSEEISRRAEQLVLDNEPESMQLVNEFLRQLVKLRADSTRSTVTSTTSELYDLALKDLTESREPARIKEPYVTWRQMFASPEMRALQLSQRVHRANVICSTMRRFGIDAVDAQVVLESQTAVNSTLNCVEQMNKDDETSDMVYLNNLASSWTVGRTGYLMRVGATKLLWHKQSLTQSAYLGMKPPFIGLPFTTTFNGRAELAEVPIFVANKSIGGTVPFRSLNDQAWSDWQRGLGLAGPFTTLTAVRMITGNAAAPGSTAPKAFYR